MFELFKVLTSVLPASCLMRLLTTVWQCVQIVSEYKNKTNKQNVKINNKTILTPSPQVTAHFPRNRHVLLLLKSIISQPVEKQEWEMLGNKSLKSLDFQIFSLKLWEFLCHEFPSDENWVAVGSNVSRRRLRSSLGYKGKMGYRVTSILSPAHPLQLHLGTSFFR